MSADDARRLNIFEGNVVLTKGTMSLRADRLVVRQDAEGFQFATATGKPARFRQRQDPKPGEKEGIWIDGEALRIELDDRNEKIELFENARVNRGGDEVAGNYILVDQRSEFFSVSSGKGTEKGRVQGDHPAQAERRARGQAGLPIDERATLAEPAQALQVAHRGPGRVARGVERRGGRAARAERRRQDHLLLHDRRPGPGRRGLDPPRRAATSPTCRSTAARAWASPTCRRKTRCSAASRWRRTCRRSSSCRACEPGEIEPRLVELLKDLNIAHLRKHAALSLSGGERRRLEIARALGTRPAFILLDEPFAGVDPIAVLDIQRIIRFLKERGIGVLITDHNVRETLGICDRAYIINEGAVLASGHPEEIVYNDSVRRVYLGENFRL